MRRRVYASTNNDCNYLILATFLVVLELKELELEVAYLSFLLLLIFIPHIVEGRLGRNFLEKNGKS